MTVYVTASCGHQIAWPCNPSSETRQELEDSLCDACWAASDPRGYAEHLLDLAVLEAQGNADDAQA